MLAPEDYPDIAEPDPLHRARRLCECCGADVLEVVVAGALVRVDVAEVEPEAECPHCRAFRLRGHRRQKCPRCGLSGRIGEALPLRGVVLSEDGRARVWTRRYDSKLRRTGDAIHCYHGPCI